MTSKLHRSVSGLQKLQVLFIHQNFPGQFVHLASAMQAAGAEVKALAIGGRGIKGVDTRRYSVKTKPVLSTDDLGSDIEVKLRRASASAEAMQVLKAEGFQPNLIVAHPGWGESMFCKDIWPRAVLIAYGEFYYQAEGADHGFDPEFSQESTLAHMRLRMRNTALLHAYTAADAILCPTLWQKSVLPRELQHKVTTIFDGIDTKLLAPNASATIRLGRSGQIFKVGDPVISFVNRNLEPYRGFHVFMRMLPKLLEVQPRAHVVIVGEDGVSYGSRPQEHSTWRAALLQEVGAKLPMDRIHFVGRVAHADYLKLLQVSACHVYLTYPFVLSWSCIEALSTGCMVVASRTAPVLEAVEDHQNGRLVDFFDQAGWCNTIAQVLNRDEDVASMRKAARDRACQQFDLHTVCLPQQLQWISSLTA